MWVNGLRRSIRIADAMEVAEDATEETLAENPAADVEDLADAVAAELAKFDNGKISGLVDKQEIAPGGGRRRKVRGGQPKRAKAEDGSAAVPTTTSKMDYLKKVGAAILEYAQKELAPIAPAGKAVVTGSVGLTQEVVVRVPVTLVTLTLSGTALSVKFFRALFAKFNAWGRASAVDLASDLTAEKAADAAVEDIPAIAKTSAVTIVFFNQLGLLPISAVIAAILLAVKANVSTGPARSLLISQFYAWYITKPRRKKDAKDGQISQEEIIDAAKAYASEAAKAGKTALDKSAPAVTALARGVGEFVAKAGVGAASAASSLVPGSSSSSSSAAAAAAPIVSAPGKSVEDILSEGSPAASVVAVAAPIVRGQDVITEGSSNAEALGEVAKNYTLRRKALGKRSDEVINLGPEEDSSLTTARRTSARTAKASLGLPPGTTQGPSSTKSERIKRPRDGGKRKTVRKIKRRVTRRKAKMPTFVY